MREGDIVIEPTTAGDVEAVTGLIGRVFEEYGFVFDPATELPDLLAFERHYGPPKGAFFVARHGGQVVGSVGVERLSDSAAELHRLYLDADLRGRGLRRTLVEPVLDWCRAAERDDPSAHGCGGSLPSVGRMAATVTGGAGPGNAQEVRAAVGDLSAISLHG